MVQAENCALKSRGQPIFTERPLGTSQDVTMLDPSRLFPSHGLTFRNPQVREG